MKEIDLKYLQIRIKFFKSELDAIQEFCDDEKFNKAKEYIEDLINNLKKLKIQI